jgi:hypothetical protein
VIETPPDKIFFWGRSEENRKIHSWNKVVKKNEKQIFG